MAYRQINPQTHAHRIIECEHISLYKSRLMTKALSKQQKCSDSKKNHKAWRTIGKQISFAPKRTWLGVWPIFMCSEFQFALTSPDALAIGND